MKSPIREDVNNFKCKRTLREVIPKGSVVNSFLFFDGALEIGLAEEDRFVVSHTNKYVIYEFWDCVLKDAQRVSEIVKSLSSLAEPDIFFLLQENWPKYKDPYVRSALFFLLNRCSESGLISAGKFKPRNYNPLAIANLNKFRLENFHVIWDRQTDFLEGFKNVKQTDYLLLPVGKFSYNFFEYGKNRGIEMTSINHERLSETLKQIQHKWVVVYKEHREIFKLYKEYNITMIDKYGKVVNNESDCEEVVIANF